MLKHVSALPPNQGRDTLCVGVWRYKIRLLWMLSVRALLYWLLSAPSYKHRLNYWPSHKHRLHASTHATSFKHPICFFSGFNPLPADLLEPNSRFMLKTIYPPAGVLRQCEHACYFDINILYWNPLPTLCRTESIDVYKETNNTIFNSVWETVVKLQL